MPRIEPVESKRGYSVASSYLERVQGDDERRETSGQAE
jgi:hypothetical protein